MSTARRTTAETGSGAALAWHPSLGWLAAGLAFVAGMASDALGSGARVNILAAPLVGVMAWNLAVFALLAWRRSAVVLGRRPRPSGPLGELAGRALAAGARWWSRHARTALAAGLPVGAPIDTARVAQVLHQAAAALTLGLLAGLYLRGLALEYLAGWESTFLDAPAVHRLLALVLGPASALTGIALPDVDRLAALRFSAGPGENAARWIHLYAVTALLVVVLPRMLLALRARRLADRAAAARIGRVARANGLSVDFRSLADRVRETGGAVFALPYSYRLPPACEAGLRALVAAEFGPGVTLELAPSFSPEDAEADGIVTAPGAAAMALAVFSLGATPEPQTHAAFVTAMRERLPPTVPLRVIVDETAFAARFTGMPSRIDERRAAWRDALEAVGAAPRFVALGAVAEPTP